MKPVDPREALETMWSLAPEYAQAKADLVFLDEFTKVQLAILMKEYASFPVNAQEREARARPEFRTHLEGLRAATEKAETLHWRLKAAQEAIGIYRTQEASNRAIDRAVQ
jgi:hypothetical protein